MNILRIIEQLSEVDADVLGRFDSRRAVFKSLGGTAQKGMLAAAPVFVASLFSKAYGQTTGTGVIDVLNYALTLELLEQDFYKKMKDAGKVPAGAPAGAIDTIYKHETAHVKLLTDTITALKGTPVTNKKFKASVFPTNDYTTQLAYAQALEDTGVRAYKGQAGALMGQMAGATSLLQVALQIHSVEARHAAHIRTMRMQAPWIPASDSNLPAPLGPVYTGATREDNTMQAGVDITKLGSGFTATEAAASFDEILTMAEVLDASRAGGLVE
ncbi:ferritin-like domain-containing protein [Hymenobacter actinosclerus]|uniref:Ferritin-like domain-containing protein n=1 Tax=Hymenobacter actinosclerus TaxID=82805 RepID=A0A1I0H5R7_9BACT|nr:ferritin-like domain-containing protein [Hymenobacter actinosclerus]SET79089.1 Ferritin-like domain-containing protein [Hymenobacter actinosclerus]